MIDLDSIDIYGNQSFADLLERIDKNSTRKAEKIEELIDELSDMIDSVNDATILVPLVKEYLEIDVQNDEKLVKVATIVQRLVTSGMRNAEELDSMGGGGKISDEEKKQLQDLAKEIREDKNSKNKTKSSNANEDSSKIDQEIKALEQKAESAKEQVKQSRKSDNQ
jgi:hypothetical protein